jgi:hypothetical protein
MSELNLADIATTGYQGLATGLDYTDMVDMAGRFAKYQSTDFLPDLPGLKGVNAVIDGAKLGVGSAKLGLGLSNGDAVQSLEGFHDVLDGGSGLLGNLPGPAGALAQAFGAGFSLGDMVAPDLFGHDAWINRPKVEEMGVDGTANPSFGPGVLGKAFDWIGDAFTGGGESLVGAAGKRKGLDGWNPD